MSSAFSGHGINLSSCREIGTNSCYQTFGTETHSASFFCSNKIAFYYFEVKASLQNFSVETGVNFNFLFERDILFSEVSDNLLLNYQ